MKKINYFWLKISLIFIGLLVSYVAIDSFIEEPWFGIRRNVSDSLPFSFFLSTKLRDIEPQMYVALEHPKSSLLIAKQVIGLPGDVMKIRNHTLYINGISYGSIREKTRSGYSIESINEGVIPEGYVFVYAPHPDSYDSRYAEFGLIAVSQLKEKLWPIF
jgi:conjugal transfer pilin signal peptidase TrbI